jgi:hypothetical protein
MRRITLTGTALAVLLLLLLGGVAIAGATPAATPDKAKTLHLDVQFSPFKLIDVDQDGGPSLGD